MPTFTRSPLGQVWAGLRALVVLTVILGVAYPLAMTAVAHVAFDHRADGSLVEQHGQIVGSRLVGQEFTTSVTRNGRSVDRPDPAFFQSRPSAGDYDPLASGATNLGPDNRQLVEQIERRRIAIAAFDGVAPGDVPADALLASASGLDPDISPAYAEEQIPRVANARGLSESEVRHLVDQNTHGRILGFLGEPTVNVLMLNLALDDAATG